MESTKSGESVFDHNLSRILLPFAWAYGGLMRLRRQAYTRGWLSSTRWPVPVISVGNLVLGGTGKTPMVAWLLENLPANLRPALVLGRGYGGTYVMEGEQLNDEGHLLRRRFPDMFHVQGADRVAAATPLLARGQVRAILLDDGAQHLRIQRDLECLMFDGRDLLRPRRCLPSGRWRETLGCVSEADVVVISRSDQLSADERGCLVQEFSRYLEDQPLLFSRHAVRDVFIPSSGETLAATCLKGRKIAAFCGIARPASFRAALTALGAEICVFSELRDHQAYSPDLVSALEQQAGAAEVLVTTEKDAVKWPMDRSTRPLWVLRIGLEFEDAQPLHQILQRLAADAR